MASQWAAKRKLLYAVIVAVFVVVAIGLPLFLFLYKTPACFDGIKNQDEKGVDCGGVCAKICAEDIAAPIVMWQRAFRVTAGVYNVVAYVQNPNVLNRVDDIGYVFRLYDKDNEVIAERTGRTFLPANKTFAVFDAGIRTGERVPVRTSFDFTGSPLWIQNPENYKESFIVAENVVLIDDSSSPRINASVRNLSLDTVKVLGVVAIVYDASDKAIAASRTVVENLPAQGVAPVTFTWPDRFSDLAVRKEIILRTYPSGFAF